VQKTAKFIALLTAFRSNCICEGSSELDTFYIIYFLNFQEI